MHSPTSRSIRLSLLPIVALILAACGATPAAVPDTASSAAPVASAASQSAAGAEPSLAAVASAGGPVTLVHWQHHSDARAAVVEQLATEFEAANPSIKIDFQSIPYNDYFQKIGPSLEAGTGPDIFQLPGPLVREYYDRGQLKPVPDDVYAAGQIEADFVPWTVQLLKQEGKYYGLPTDVQSFLMFYNNALFREAGLDPTKTLETFDEFTAAAVKLTKRDGETLTQAGVDITSSPYQMYWSLLTTGSPEGVVDDKTLKVTYNSEQGYAMWEFLTGLVTEHKVDSAEFLAGQSKFALGKAAINAHEYVYAGTLEQTAPDLEYSVHLPPHAPGQEPVTGGTHWAYVVSEQTEHQAEAWAWAKFLTSEAAQRKWIAGGGELPSLSALIADEQLRSEPNTAAALDAMQNTQPFDDFGWDDVYAIQQAVWDNVVLNGTDVKTAVDQAAAAEEKLYQDKKIKPAP